MLFGEGTSDRGSSLSRTSAESWSGDDEKAGVELTEARRQERGTGSCVRRGRLHWTWFSTDPSRHVLWGVPLADQTSSVRLIQPGGLRGSHACLASGLLQE